MRCFEFHLKRDTISPSEHLTTKVISKRFLCKDFIDCKDWFCKERKMSCSPNFNHFKTSWMIICILAAISTIIWQLLNYLSGQDSTIVEFREFNKDKIDVYPNIGVCFSRFFIHDIDRVDP